MALNWFRKNRDDKEGPQGQDLAPEASPLEDGANDEESHDGDRPSTLDSDSTPGDKGPETSGEQVDVSSEAPLLPESESREDVSAGSKVSEGEKPASFFRGAWEATKKLALTPVDPFFENMVAGLDRTRRNLLGQLSNVFRLHKRIDEDFWEELEDILITSDVGTAATERILSDLQGYAQEHRLNEPPALRQRLREVIEEILLTEEEKRTLNIEPGRVNVILMVGVNGAGKTTSTAKLTSYFKEQGMSVVLAAADTFRAAAIEQLESWAHRLNVPLIKHKEGSDPAAVVYDACSAAKARGADILLIDTAGRLQNKSNLMKELEKIHRIIGRELPDAPHEVLLVLDATTGQNALSQAKQFSAVTPISGLVMCKLDGSARGGIMVAVAQEFGIPVKFLGVGEKPEDLRPFEPKMFVDALFDERSSRSD